MTDGADRPADEPATEVAGPEDGPDASLSAGSADGPLPAQPADASNPPGSAGTPPRRTRRAGRAPDTRRPVPSDAGGAASLDSSVEPSLETPAPRPERAVPLRLARLHLRMGQLQLARAELEALTGRDALDEPALLDLAEARWRTGDLTGAGEVATALLARGRDEAFALLIAAEFVAAEGRPGEARRLAARAVALIDPPLDAVFAGMPRSLIWPDDAPSVPDPSAALGAGMAAVHAELGHAERTRRAAADGDPGTPASTVAAEAYAGGRAALAGGDVGGAAVGLGIALRLDPGFAEGVLEAVGAWERDPALALVAGDALRLLGRETEALDAFELARGRA